MQLNALCNRRAIACILGTSARRFLTTSTEGRSGYTAKNLRFVAKTSRVMQLTAILLTVFTMSVAARSVSQSITFSGHNVKLEQVFAVINQQTNYAVLYDKGVLRDAPKVSIQANQMPLTDFLYLIFQDQSLTYSIRSKTVTVKAKTHSPSASLTIAVPPITVRGRILNEKGEPVVASVIVKGTNRGTTTDNFGSFSIDNIADNATLVISGVTIETQEIRVDNRSEINITVTTKVGAENEVIINGGYYKTTNRNKTGSIVKVTSRDIEKQPVSNPLAALQGRVAGMEITQQNGVPGSNFKVRIRGTNSIANGNDPLYIIDGVPYTSTTMSFSETSGNILGSSDPNASQGSSPLNNINPNDIESIEVLKDADATAIYGSRGANGVVLLTTKKGKDGKTKVGFNIYSGLAKVPNKMNLLSTQQYLQMRNEAFQNDNIIPDNGNARDLKVWDTTRYTDWQKVLIGGTANITSAQMSVSGGSKNTQFLIGGGYHKETTVYPGDNDMTRISVHSNISNTSNNNKFKLSWTTNYSSGKTTLVSQDLTTKALLLAPIAPAVYDEEGNLNWDGWSVEDENPLAFLKRPFESTTNNLISNLVLSYSILNNLDIKTSLGYTTITNHAITTMPISSLSPDNSDKRNRSTFSTSNFHNWIVEPQLNWKPKVGKGRLDVVLGTTFLEQGTDGLAQYAIGFASESLMKNIASAPTVIGGTNYYSQYRYNAFFGRINYVLNERYILNLTGRRDGSSRFGPGKQFANFGALGAAWIFTEETFLKNTVPFLSFGKLRASYGVMGNDQIGDYQFLDSYTSSPGQYQGVVGLSPSRLFNGNFAWEENQKIEAGLELGLLTNKIFIEANYYRNRSSNQLVGSPLAPTTGFGSIQANFPATVQNQGIEIQVNTKNISSHDFSWTTGFNITLPKNKLVAFPKIDQFPAYQYTYVVGEPIAIYKLYHGLGIDNATGIYQFTDFNNDEVFSIDDQQAVRFAGQKFYGGLQNIFAYKGFELDILFQFVKQQGWNYTHLFNNAPGTLFNQPDLVMDRWQKPGDEASVQQFTTGGTASSAFSSQLYFSDQVVADASFIRLKNLSLSYNLPVRWLSKIKSSNARVYVQGQNLFTLTDYEGLNPETPGARVLPALRTLTFGINISF